jgi:uncharacterized protein GlcG (DUF336 family)
MTLAHRIAAFVTAASFLLASCGGGGGSSAGNNPNPGTTPTSVYAVPAQEALTSAEVTQIISQAVGEAQARGLPSVISVVDRVGNVLAVYEMTGAAARAKASDNPSGNPNLDVQGVDFPASLGSIAKAITAAYLSSGGNAFTTRTASNIVQEHFPKAPNTVGLESGPLFGVQFSSLPCSDLVRRFGADQLTGPKRSPLGLAADPGAVPLYKNGVVVGGIGVMGDGDYGSDPNAIDTDDDDEEYIALAGSTGFEAPDAIRANRISIDGTLLDFIDAAHSQLAGNGATPALAGAGSFAAVPGYFTAAAPLAGTPYGSAASGIRPSTSAERTGGSVIDNPDAFILVDIANQNRFPLRAGTDAGDVAQPLTQAEVKAVMEEAFIVMSRARGAIRQPLDSRAQVTISIVDTRGSVLGLTRSPDAPVFGTDVALQKARTAAFFSGPRAAADLSADPQANVSDYVARVRAFLNDPAALTGSTAFADRPIGLLARPYFPDGQVGTPNGPLSRPIADFNVFSTGLQSALIVGNLAEHIGFVQGTVPTDTATRCTQLPDIGGTGQNRLQNGIQIFPGGVAIYRGNTLVGAIGISGDGIDQDDMIAFLGLYNGGRRAGTIGHADPAIRISQKSFPTADGGFLPYVQCPFAPFIDTSDQNVCQGK